jgi:hypothetical protein
VTRVWRIIYSAAEMQWLSDNRAMVISDYHAAFCAAFERSDVTAAHLHSLRKRKGWKVGRAPGRLAGRRQGRRMPVSDAEIQWLREKHALPIAEYHRGFCATFLRNDITAAQLHSLRKREGWRTGRSGRFAKGGVPANKGKKMPYNANSAATRFKKGMARSGKAAEKYKPIGTEMIRDGYLVRKIHDGFPMQSRWRAVHLLNWEALHGPIAEGMALKCKGERSNTDPSNWDLVPRSMLPRLNNQWGRNYDTAPAELKPTIMAVAKLEHGVSVRRKQLNTSQQAVPT